MNFFILSTDNMFSHGIKTLVTQQLNCFDIFRGTTAIVDVDAPGDISTIKNECISHVIFISKLPLFKIPDIDIHQKVMVFFINKKESVNELVRKIKCALRTVKRNSIPDMPQPRESRKKKMLYYLTRGYDDNELSSLLNISISIVRRQRKLLLGLTGVSGFYNERNLERQLKMINNIVSFF